ncbi:hypothetical protein B0H13DRAFT_1850064 [Mycena leptocephala]|nr:hypothetical protein B0H13DRAFT_1850064 [Mycena leptocephala]
MVYPRRGDVFYLRALLLHRTARDWIDLRTINGVVHGTYQEAARAMGLFNNRDEGIMAFEELLESGTPPTQLRWIFAVLAVEGSSALTIWGAHECALSADIKDSMQRVTPDPPAPLSHLCSSDAREKSAHASKCVARSTKPPSGRRPVRDPNAPTYHCTG